MHGIAISNVKETHVDDDTDASPRIAASAWSRIRNITRHNRRHGIWILMWSLVGWIGTALAPVLVDKPLVLMLLSPRAVFVALASSSVSLVPFVVLGTLRLSVTDASYFVIGRKLPNDLRTDPAPRPGRLWHTLRRLTRRGDAACAWFCMRPRLTAAFLFVRPNGKYLGLAGAYGVSSWVAGLAATAGTATFLAAVHLGLGAVF